MPRSSPTLKACPDQQFDTVQGHLTGAFRRYGLPDRILADNGPPWGAPYVVGRNEPPHTRLAVWLHRLGVSVSHSRPFHPQTLGKGERFHLTVDVEVLRYEHYRSLEDCQTGFDTWRQIYNLERPHEALDMDVPADRYQPSPRPFPELLPPIVYGPADEVRTVYSKGRITFEGQQFLIGAAFGGLARGPAAHPHRRSLERLLLQREGEGDRPQRRR